MDIAPFYFLTVITGLVVVTGIAIASTIKKRRGK